MNAIETDALSKRFGNRAAVDGLSLVVPQGQVFGFLGPNGAGKTTTIRMLTALIAPSSGKAAINGFRLGRDDTDIRRTVGILTETPGMYDRLSALQNLIFFAGLYDVPVARASQSAERYLQAMDLWERRDDKVGGFSKGMRQKLAIVRCLLHSPQTIFLDEPTSGLDPEAALTVHSFIRTLSGEGRTVFLTTHNLNEADTLCDMIGVFRQHMIRVGTPAQLRTSLFGAGTVVTLTADAAAYSSVLKALPFVKGTAFNGGTISAQLDNPELDNPALVHALVMAGAPVRYVQPASHSLQEVYLELVGDSEQDVAARTGMLSAPSPAPALTH